MTQGASHRLVAIKCYGFDWQDRFGLSEPEAAGRLAAHGADWALLQNTLDPLPGSDVEQHVPAAVDERRLRSLLRERGIKVFETTSVFFQPGLLSRRPDLRPVAADGRRMEPFGWYVGLCPSDERYLAQRVELMERVVAELEPDGVFLSFIRFPGFWEAWTPKVRREQIAEYCFCERCLARFRRDTGIELPPRGAPALLQGELRGAWTEWKCALIAAAARALGRAARRTRPGIEVLINGVPLRRGDLGGAAEEVLGQDLGRLSVDAEHTEVMAYHQILAREPVNWIEELVADVRPRVKGTLLACLQLAPAYTTGVHAGAGRRADMTRNEILRALDAVAASGCDGVGIYHWSDLLADDRSGGRLGRALRAFRAGELAGEAA
jgi:hypothetical protein